MSQVIQSVSPFSLCGVSTYAITATLALAPIIASGCRSKPQPYAPDPGWELTTPGEDAGSPTLESIDFSQPEIRLPPGTLDWAPPDKTVILHTLAGDVPGPFDPADADLVIRYRPVHRADRELQWQLDALQGRLVFVGIDGDLHGDELHLYQCISGAWYFWDYSVRCGVPGVFEYFVQWKARASNEPAVAENFLAFFRRSLADDDRVTSYTWIPSTDFTMVREFETFAIETEGREWSWRIDVDNSIHPQTEGNP